MTPPSLPPLQDLIKWDFTLAEQTLVSRYGRYAGAFWKQFMPAGLIVPELHPPKKIPEVLYNRAKQRLENG